MGGAPAGRTQVSPAGKTLKGDSLKKKLVPIAEASGACRFNSRGDRRRKKTDKRKRRVTHAVKVLEKNPSEKIGNRFLNACS